MTLQAALLYRSHMFARASRSLLTALLVVYGLWQGSVRAQSEEEALRLRLEAAYAAAPTLSNGCSLAEAERRAGRVAEATQRLDALLESALEAPAPTEPEARATLSACRFNRARLFEESGDLREAYRFLVDALDTDNIARLHVVEQRLVAVGARLATQSGCGSLPSRFSALALLRFADNAVLRRCVASGRRTAPFCRALAAAHIPDMEARDGVRRPDENTAVLVDDRFLVVVTTRGRRVSGVECELGSEDERLGMARFHRVAGARVLEFVTESRVSYACDDCDEGGEDCRCADEAELRYFMGPRNELLLVLVPAWVDAGSLVASSADSPELRESDGPLTSVEGALILINGRRLRLVRGALVPAP